MKRKGTYDLVKVEHCLKYTGKYPTSVRWVDTDKWTDEEQNVRCRLVARGFKVAKAGDCFYASMLTLESNYILFAKIAETYGRLQAGKEQAYWKITLMDVKKARLEAAGDRDHTYVELPLEDAKEGYCAKLKTWL